VGARRYQLPTTIARLSVPYGDRGGWPAIHLEMVLAGNPIAVHANAPSIYHPIHERDIVAMVPGSWRRPASLPRRELGRERPGQHRGVVRLLRRADREGASFEPTDQTLDSVAIDVTKMTELLGATTVGWRDGMRQMVRARHPELF